MAALPALSEAVFAEPDCRPVIISRMETCRDCGWSALDLSLLNVIGTAVLVHASTRVPRAVHLVPGKVKGRSCADPRRRIHANFIAFLAQEAKLKKSLTHLSVAV